MIQIIFWLGAENIFFMRRMRKIRKLRSECARKKEPQDKPSQRVTSQRTCSHPPHRTWMEVSLTAPTAARLSRRDKPNARAPQQAINVLHLLCHARLAAARTARGSDLVLTRARPAMKRQVSSEQRPLTSHASTTRRALPCSPVSSG